MTPSSPAPPAATALPPFSFENDRFAFANETVWNYIGGRVESGDRPPPPGARRYTRRCFVVSRAAVQFWKFARFAPEAPPPDDAALARLVRRVCARSVWRAPLPPERRVVIPGYANLREASAARAGIFQDHMGLGWPIYFRMGNFPIILPMSGRARARVDLEIARDLARGFPTILWLYNFPSLSINHAVVAYAAEEPGPDGRRRYLVYDPNYTDAPKRLEFDPAARRFSFQPTFYFAGGTVTARPVYRGYFE